MPSTPTGTKKTLQELSRVFNKLAFELTSELTHAKAEIENLRKEVSRLKSNPSRANTATKQSKNQRTTGRTTGYPNRKPTPASQSAQHQKTQNPTASSANVDTSEYIFPREPFNPPSPPEPSPPSNN